MIGFKDINLNFLFAEVIIRAFEQTNNKKRQRKSMANVAERQRFLVQYTVRIRKSTMNQNLI